MIAVEDCGKIISGLEFLFNIALLIISFLIIFIDIKKLVIPDTLSLLFITMIIIKKGFHYYTIERSILGMGVYILPFIFIYGYISELLKRELVGFGDIKLLLGIGYWMEYQSFYELYFYYFVTFLVAAAYIMISFAIYRKVKREIPFAPFLLISFIYFYFKGNL